VCTFAGERQLFQLGLRAAGFDWDDHSFILTSQSTCASALSNAAMNHRAARSIHGGAVTIPAGFDKAVAQNPDATNQVNLDFERARHGDEEVRMASRCNNQLRAVSRILPSGTANRQLHQLAQPRCGQTPTTTAVATHPLCL
jgi:hypothetical protein